MFDSALTYNGKVYDSFADMVRAKEADIERAKRGLPDDETLAEVSNDAFSSAPIAKKPTSAEIFNKTLSSLTPNTDPIDNVGVSPLKKFTPDTLEDLKQRFTQTQLPTPMSTGSANIDYSNVDTKNLSAIDKMMVEQKRAADELRDRMSMPGAMPVQPVFYTKEDKKREEQEAQMLKEFAALQSGETVAYNDNLKTAQGADADTKLMAGLVDAADKIGYAIGNAGIFNPRERTTDLNRTISAYATNVDKFKEQVANEENDPTSARSIAARKLLAPALINIGVNPASLEKMSAKQLENFKGTVEKFSEGKENREARKQAAKQAAYNAQMQRYQIAENQRPYKVATDELKIQDAARKDINDFTRPMISGRANPVSTAINGIQAAERLGAILYPTQEELDKVIEKNKAAYQRRSDLLKVKYPGDENAQKRKDELEDFVQTKYLDTKIHQVGAEVPLQLAKMFTGGIPTGSQVAGLSADETVTKLTNVYKTLLSGKPLPAKDGAFLLTMAKTVAREHDVFTRQYYDRLANEINAAMSGRNPDPRYKQRVLTELQGKIGFGKIPDNSVILKQRINKDAGGKDITTPTSVKPEVIKTNSLLEGFN